MELVESEVAMEEVTDKGGISVNMGVELVK